MPPVRVDNDYFLAGFERIPHDSRDDECRPVNDRPLHEIDAERMHQLGTSGAIAKLLALPVFCSVVILTRLLSSGIGLAPLRTILIVKVVLLVAGATLAIRLGPFSNGDAWPAIVTGMTLVAAMAVQNAVHRIHLANAPPTTLMTGTTTQIMIDLADMIQRPLPSMDDSAGSRLLRMSISVGSFAVRCASAVCSSPKQASGALSYHP